MINVSYNLIIMCRWNSNNIFHISELTILDPEPSICWNYWRKLSWRSNVRTGIFFKCRYRNLWHSLDTYDRISLSRNFPLFVALLCPPLLLSVTMFTAGYYKMILHDILVTGCNSAKSSVTFERFYDLYWFYFFSKLLSAYFFLSIYFICLFHYLALFLYLYIYILIF